MPTGDGGSRITVSSNGGTEPVWDRSGARLFYRRRDDVMAVTFDLGSGAFGASEVLMDGRGDLMLTPQGNPNYDVSPDERFLMVQQGEESRTVELHVVLNWDREQAARMN